MINYHTWFSFSLSLPTDIVSQGNTSDIYTLRGKTTPFIVDPEGASLKWLKLLLSEEDTEVEYMNQWETIYANKVEICVK